MRRGRYAAGAVLCTCCLLVAAAPESLAATESLKASAMWLTASGGLAAAESSAASGNSAAPESAASASLPAVVPEGLSAGGHELGGLRLEEANRQIESYVAAMAAQPIFFQVGDSLVETTGTELGFYWENSGIVAETVREYETGNVIERYLKKKDLKMNPVKLELEFQIEKETFERFVEEKCAPLLKEAVDASITRSEGQFVITPSEEGQMVDADASRQRLADALKEGVPPSLTVEAVVKVKEPARTTEMLSSIRDVMGTYSTDFSSSSKARATNLKVGAEKLNGAVLMPGETLSGYERMQPFTTDNGYATAAAYENGQVVDSVGGGVCQIATTLYNAALLAELEITERQSHSMIVTYVPPSRDAAIAGTYKDIKITNPYDTPIYVEAGTSGRTLTFTIYGHETRPPNRTVEYISETLSTTSPGEPITKYDSALSPGDKVRVQSSHTGRKSRLWKCVYVDGVEVERTLLHTDTYRPSPAVYRVGPMIRQDPAGQILPPRTDG